MFFFGRATPMKDWGPGPEGGYLPFDVGPDVPLLLLL